MGGWANIQRAALYHRAQRGGQSADQPRADCGRAADCVDLLASYSSPNAQLTEARARLESLAHGQSKQDDDSSKE